MSCGIVEHRRYASITLFIVPPPQQTHLSLGYLPTSISHPVLQWLRIGPFSTTERLKAPSHATGNMLLHVEVARAHKWLAIPRNVAG